MKVFPVNVKRLLCLVTTPVFLVLFCLFCHAAYKKVSNAEVDRIALEIKNIAREVMHSPEIKAKPDIEINRQKKELIYGRGSISPLPGFEEDDPWNLPLEMQIHVDLLTEIFDKLQGGKAIWTPYKEQAEVYIINGTIRDLLTYPPNNIKQHMTRREKEFERFIGETVLPFDQVARKNGLTAVKDEGYGAAEDMLKVEVFTEPPGGTVKVIPLLVYRVYQSLGKSSDMSPWKSLLRNTELLLGKYKYIVAWPDGSTKEGQLELKYKDGADDTPEKITFKR